MEEVSQNVFVFDFEEIVKFYRFIELSCTKLSVEFCNSWYFVVSKLLRIPDYFEIPEISKIIEYS
jgi:hypothetical protein